ncbi:hypothetical protein B0T16DRAFT_517874 [Cercophora newfieldiana]|uniref:Uncharacterized protein n=1 Tax=Cercophora newfieldiana TaxID=92897 RepID=A0AA40CHK6_9PEZI|nr:hypothetical protein B0T16DRAFT_517874 [Cercophora newfieldiana]
MEQPPAPREAQQQPQREPSSRTNTEPLQPPPPRPKPSLPTPTSCLSILAQLYPPSSHTLDLSDYPFDASTSAQFTALWETNPKAALQYSFIRDIYLDFLREVHYQRLQQQQDALATSPPPPPGLTPPRTPFLLDENLPARLGAGTCQNMFCAHGQGAHTGFGLCFHCERDFWCPICANGVPEIKYCGMCQVCYAELMLWEKETKEGQHLWMEREERDEIGWEAWEKEQKEMEKGGLEGNGVEVDKEGKVVRRGSVVNGVVIVSSDSYRGNGVQGGMQGKGKEKEKEKEEKQEMPAYWEGMRRKPSQVQVLPQMSETESIWDETVEAVSKLMSKTPTSGAQLGKTWTAALKVGDKDGSRNWDVPPTIKPGRTPSALAGVGCFLRAGGGVVSRAGAGASGRGMCPFLLGLSAVVRRTAFIRGVDAQRGGSESSESTSLPRIFPKGPESVARRRFSKGVAGRESGPGLEKKGSDISVMLVNSSPARLRGWGWGSVGSVLLCVAEDFFRGARAESLRLRRSRRRTNFNPCFGWVGRGSVGGDSEGGGAPTRDVVRAKAEGAVLDGGRAPAGGTARGRGRKPILLGSHAIGSWFISLSLSACLALVGAEFEVPKCLSAA